MKVLGLRWLGSRTGHLDAMTRLFGEVLGLPVGLEQPDARVFDLPDGSAVEVFKPTDTDHSFFEHPVAGLLVDDVREVRAHMESHGIEFIGEVHDGIETSWATAWSHFRAPDGFVYVLVSRAATPTARAFDEARICLRVSDLDAAIRLYRDGLGMTIVDQWEHPGGQRGVLFGVVPAAIEIFDETQWDLVDESETGRTLRRDHALRFEARDLAHLSELAASAADAGATYTGEVTRTPWDQTCLRMESDDGEQLTLFVLPDAERTTRTEARRHLGA